MTDTTGQHPLLARVPRIQLFAVFEVAARHRSFTHAAAELGMTQSGVSRQVSQLEQLLDQQLFDRSANQVQLNESGTVLLAAVQAGFTSISQGLDAIERTPNVFVVAANPGFAQVWLVPHLDSLRHAFGDVQLHLHLFDRDSELHQSHFDAAIHLSQNDQVGPSARHLFAEVVVPVAAPSYAHLHGLTPDTTPDRIANLDLLHLDGRDRQWIGWPQWFTAQGKQWSQHGASLTYNNHALVIEDAFAGRGIALGWVGLIDAALADGRVVQVGPSVASSDTGYHLIPGTRASTIHIDILATWLGRF